MVLKRANWAAGRVVTVEYVSEILADNPLGDPATRAFDVWLPPQYDRGSGRGRGRRFPVLFDLAGFTSSGVAHTNWRNFDENVPERAARLVHENRMRPCIIVFPDCFTALGGNQFINSSAVGHYADYLTRELVPFIDSEFRTRASRDHRGCFGRSSGGYGAMIHGMRYPRVWGAIANHSGDAYFDFLYRIDWPNTLDTLASFRRRQRREGLIDVEREEAGSESGYDDGRVARFLKNVWSRSKLTADEVHCLMNVAMAATYDPDPDAPNGFRLPFNLETGELIPERWRQWLRHDPTNLVKRYAKNLKTLRGIFIDCGWKDQYQMHYGARILSKRLRQAGVEHRYEEFPDTHSGIDYRLDRSLPFLSRALR
ncbi:MAG TPA: alpha/beta hydrolase-fold protein [Gammaproteobacteria bacterium]